MMYTPGDRYPVDLPTPPCVICGEPGVCASGYVNRPEERWYCVAHMNRAVLDVALPEQVNTSYPPPVRPYVSALTPWVVTPRDRRSRRRGERRRRSGGAGPWWWTWLRNRGWR